MVTGRTCATARRRSASGTGAGAEGQFEGQELAQVRLACPGVHLAHLETNRHHLKPLQIGKT